MKINAKTKQIAVRFDSHSYERITRYAEQEHRGLGEFVRHATLFYIEHFDKQKDVAPQSEDSHT
ncbi:MAG: hypothetical protein FWC75_06510 [Oscillospiraceae bacterium]|nr:hypothetical protein [Oscillospiraceae bacterium]